MRYAGYASAAICPRACKVSAPRPVRILGVDPGSRATGYAILDAVADVADVVDHGVLRLPSKAPLTERLRTLHDRIVQLVRHHDPDEVVLEEAFAAANVRSALVLGQVRGVVVVAVGSVRPVFEYSARTVKKAVAGYGQADKQQVAQMVTRLLRLPEVPPQDAADALALAICHMHSRTLAVRLGGVER
ncbi:MAG: crossover junction endodeoxyribonuclease RuvC [Acidobacteriota bacterium]